MQAWAHIMKALHASEVPEDKALAQRVARFVTDTPYYKELVQGRKRDAVRQDQQRTVPVQSQEVAKTRAVPEIER